MILFDETVLFMNLKEYINKSPFLYDMTQNVPKTKTDWGKKVYNITHTWWDVFPFILTTKPTPHASFSSDGSYNPVFFGKPYDAMFH